MPRFCARSYSTSSCSALENVASPCSSMTRSESWLSKCFQMRRLPEISGSPSRMPVTRQPPSSSIIWMTMYAMKTQDEGIHATNQDFIRYDQVEKRQSYHLAESESEDQFDDDFVIRTCDMRSPTFARELGDALREIGFAILSGHGVDPALYDEAEVKIEEMFGRLSMEEKMRYRAQRHGSVNQGYFPIKETSNMHPDLVEGWVFCRRAFEGGDF